MEGPERIDFLLVIAVALVAACGTPTYSCSTDDACRRAGATGQCVPAPESTSSYCAFFDLQCAAPRLRWDRTAPVELASTCVPGCGGPGADCDGIWANGCETDLDADPRHCGACGNDCGPRALGCQQGRCVAAVRSVSCGLAHTCSLHEDGTVRCWGNNSDGQLGIGSTDPLRRRPSPVEHLAGIEQVATGWRHTCARRAAGDVACWGSNQEMQLGIGSQAGRIAPVWLARVNNAVDLAAGQLHTCIARPDGTAACWGWNRWGTLGSGRRNSEGYPTDVIGLPGPIVEMAAGNASTCARLASGGVLCWGHNGEGQLGGGRMEEDRLQPGPVGGVLAVSLSLFSDHVCALAPNGRVFGWGETTSGQLGTGLSREGQAVPAEVPGFGAVPEVVAGDSHTCARLHDGTVLCVGENIYGQLGDGTFTDRLEPTPVTGLSDVVDLCAGQLHTCAVVASGGVLCWGENTSGQLGGGDVPLRPIPTPTPVRF